MLFYIFFFSIIYFTAFFYYFKFTRKTKYTLWGILLLLLIFHDGLRWETGTDWIPYLEYFETCSFLKEHSSRMDIGYHWMNCFVAFFTNKYIVFLLFHACILYTLLFCSLREYSINPFLSLALYYSMFLPYLGMNRQIIALAICLYSVKYIISKQKVYFILCIIVALLFHKSAIIFIISYFFSHRFSLKAYLIILSTAIIISFSGIIYKLPTLVLFLLDDISASKMNVYAGGFGLDKANPLFTFLSYLKKIIWLVPFFFMRNYIKVKNNYINLFFNFYFFSLVFYIIFNNSILQIVVSRGLLYYAVSEIFILPYIVTIFKQNLSRIIFIFILYFYCILNMQKGVLSYRISTGDDIFVPYKGVFINTDYKRQMH